MSTVEYTHPDVFTKGVREGWAEPESDPTRIDWPDRQARAAIHFDVVNGRPVNPYGPTGIRYGRNELGHWGELVAADALVTLDDAAGRWLAMIERDDGHGWAIPGGGVDPGETALQAAVRELAEETGLNADDHPHQLRALPARYVPDPRASDEAWMVTVPVRIHLGTRTGHPVLTGATDARQAAWIHADSYPALRADLASRGGKVFPAHKDMLSELCRERAGW